MLDLLRRLLPTRHPNANPLPPPAGSGVVSVDAQVFDFAMHARWHEGVPHPDWDAATTWQQSLAAPRRDHAWGELERGWLDWLRGAIGLRYRLYESDVALLLTAQSERLAQIKLGYLGATLRRIERALEELAGHDHAGKEILIAFDDADDYYRYVSAFEADGDDPAVSAGVHIGHGCSHFATHGEDLGHLEPTIVHEMTHSCVAHLPLPLWLNEGLAQGIEQRFSPGGRDPHAALDVARRQTTFWTPETIQEFWSGRAFSRLDKRQEMAYALALMLTEAFARDWPRFKTFVLDAHHADAGMAAARERLDVELGEYLRLLLVQPDGQEWGPRPERWSW
jgi:hypothetical protein